MGVTTLVKVKEALRIKSTAFDNDLSLLIESAKADLGVAGVINLSENDPLIERAIITYCAMNSINQDADRREWLKRSYDEQKAQLSTCTGFTDWGKANG